MKVKTSYVPEGCGYLTVGKEYEVDNVEGSCWIVDDENIETLIDLEKDEHNLGGHTWEIVK